MMDYLDFPTAWALSPKCDHDPACSYAMTKGAFLCDCGAIEALWAQMKEIPSAVMSVTVCERYGV